MEQSQLKHDLSAYLRHELPSFFSILAFLSITALLFRSLEFALIVTASLGFHELGHAVALMWYKQEYRIFFGVVGAWTWSRLDQRQYLSQLSNTYVHLAGPMFSLLLALGALTLDRIWNPSSNHLELLANFSAQVGFLNLLPLGIYTDGGKVLRRMAMSVNGGRGKKIIIGLSAASVVIPVLYARLQVSKSGSDLSAEILGLLLIGFWLLAGILAELVRTGAPQLSASKPMNPRQITFVAVLVWDMLVLLFILTSVTPFWLSAEYLMGIIENLKLALELVVKLFL